MNNITDMNSPIDAVKWLPEKELKLATSSIDLWKRRFNQVGLTERIVDKLLCLFGNHQYKLQECDGPLGLFYMIHCIHCNKGHRINRTLR